MNEHKPLKLDVTPVPAQGMAFVTTSHKGKGKKASGRTKTLATPTGKQWAQKLRLRSSTLTRKQQRMMTIRNLLPEQSQQKQLSPFHMKSLEKDNSRLAKSVSALQKCKEGDDDDLSISFAKGLSQPSNFLRNHILKLHLLWNWASHSIWTWGMFSCWTASQRMTWVATWALCPGSRRQVVLWTWQAMVVVWRSSNKASSHDTSYGFG
jgi:hypothetical protein